MAVNVKDKKNITLFDFDNDTDKKNNRKTDTIINQVMFLDILSKIENLNENNKIKLEIQNVIEIIKNPRKDILGLLNVSSNGDTAIIKKEILLEDFNQILEVQTIERANINSAD